MLVLSRNPANPSSSTAGSKSPSWKFAVIGSGWVSKPPRKSGLCAEKVGPSSDHRDGGGNGVGWVKLAGHHAQHGRRSRQPTTGRSIEVVRP